MRRLRTFVIRRSRLVLACTLVLAIVAAIYGVPVVDRLDPQTQGDPQSASMRAVAALEDARGISVDPHVIVIVPTPRGASTAAGQARIAEVAAGLRRIPGIKRVDAAPTLPAGAPPEQIARAAAPFTARDGSSAMVMVYLAPGSAAKQQRTVDEVVDQLAPVRGLKLAGVAMVNREVNEVIAEDLHRSEAVIVPILLLLTFLFFRSFVAATIPVVIAGLSVLLTFLVLRIANEFTPISSFSVNLTTALAAGLAIDYGLLLVSRFREELAGGAETVTAVQRMEITAGRAVAYSALTVSSSMAGMLVFPQNYLASMGFAGVIVALTSGLTALVVVPALLVQLGPRVNSLSPRWLQRRSAVTARSVDDGGWFKLAQWVSKRAVLVAILASSVMIALGIPAFTNLSFTTVDETVLPASSPVRTATNVLRRDFPGQDGSQVSVVTQGRTAGKRARSIEADLRDRLPQAAKIAAPERVGSGRGAREVQLVRVTLPSRDLTAASKRDVRSMQQVSAGHRGLVAGVTAEFLDHQQSVQEGAVWALLIVVAATVLFIMLLTGSVVLPVKAVVMNTLTLSATFGILTWIFTEGHLEGVLNFTSQGGLEVGQPVLVCALVFGLSTDYGVFLLSRVKESVDAGIDTTRAVCIGTERTGRIITTAALLFCVAMGATAASRLVTVKQVGLGVGLAVLIDATIVRALLVPALMKLLGARNWWAPSFIQRISKRLSH